jgi:SNF2 family DNA or RNA helicase
MLSRSDLHPYQTHAVEYIKEKKKCALFLDLGLGKTTTTLTTLTDLIDSFSCSKVLIIAPLRVANSVWAQEADKWEHLQHLKIAIVTGDLATRKKALAKDADIYVINRENVPWLIDTVPHNTFDAIVIDESSSFKTHSSKRFKALKKLTPHAAHIILLTGTPSPNGLMDLWSQMFLIDSGKALGKTITSYRDRYFMQEFNGFGYKARAGSHDKIKTAIAPITLSMQASDYLTMPDKIIIDQEITLPGAVQKRYDDFEKRMILDLEDGESVEALNAAALAGKLLQFCAGAIYTDDQHTFEIVHDAKIDALKELTEVSDETMLVAYNFKSDLARLKEAFPDAIVLDKDPMTIERWNRGEIKMLLAHPASAGHGLNLQYGGSLLIWFSLNWNLEYYLQFNARLYRQGQTKPVRIVHLIAKDCLDERVLKALNNKDLSQSALLNALKH